MSFILGPAIGGIVLALGDVTTAFVLNAITFVIIAVILWGLPPNRPGAGHVITVTDAETTLDARIAAPAVPLQRRPWPGSSSSS